jgi:hypothetical protein
MTLPHAILCSGITGHTDYVVSVGHGARLQCVQNPGLHWLRGLQQDLSMRFRSVACEHGHCCALEAI